jgi:hypothetical protein
MVAALLRAIFNAEAGEAAHALVGDALERLHTPLPKVAALLEEAEEDLLAFYGFPADHWAKLRSTNPLERVNREIGRRTDVVGISRTTARSSAWQRASSSSKTTSGSSAAATSVITRWKRSSIERKKARTTERRRGSSRRPEPPTMPTSYTTSRDLTTRRPPSGSWDTRFMWKLRYTLLGWLVWKLWKRRVRSKLRLPRR